VARVSSIADVRMGMPIHAFSSARRACPVDGLMSRLVGALRAYRGLCTVRILKRNEGGGHAGFDAFLLVLRVFAGGGGGGGKRLKTLSWEREPVRLGVSAKKKRARSVFCRFPGA